MRCGLSARDLVSFHRFSHTYILSVDGVLGVIGKRSFGIMGSILYDMDYSPFLFFSLEAFHSRDLASSLL